MYTLYFLFLIQDCSRVMVVKTFLFFKFNYFLLLLLFSMIQLCRLKDPFFLSSSSLPLPFVTISPYIITVVQSFSNSYKFDILLVYYIIVATGKGRKYNIKGFSKDKFPFKEEQGYMVDCPQSSTSSHILFLKLYFPFLIFPLFCIYFRN